jgi:hypothetical protein
MTMPHGPYPEPVENEFDSPPLSEIGVYPTLDDFNKLEERLIFVEKQLYNHKMLIENIFRRLQMQ